MLNIDEAIEHAREVAEMHRNDIIPKENYHNMPWIDMENELNMRSAEEHEQLAEWLEELKAYKAIGTVKECKNSVLDIPKAYNKAIDDFVEDISLKISDSFIWGKIADCFKSKNINDTSDEIIVYIINTANEIAEQLKKKI